MARQSLLFLVCFLALGTGAACGDDSSNGGGGGSSTGTSTGTSSGTSSGTSTGTSSGTTASGGGGAGGSAGGDVGGAGVGGGPSCPDISCSVSCPGDTWPDIDNCPSCACAADLEMLIGGFPRHFAHVSASVQASEFIGGIDRWVFDFLWQFDDPNASDDAEDVNATVRIMKLGPQFEPDATNVTYFTPEDDGNPLEVLQGQYTLYGFALQTADLVPVDGFFSIRRVNDVFEGHVSLDFDVSGGGSPQTVHVATPFSVPVP